MSNATTFSTYSKGLKDVLMVQKTSTIKNAKFWKSEDSEKKEDILCKQWEETDGDTNFDQVYNDREFNPDTGYIGGLKSITSTFAPAIIGRYTNKSKSPMPFFLPFKLDLTMHGLGGIKIYDGFQVNGRGLPATYNPTSIKLLVKSLSHTVSLEGWKTKISTTSFPISDVTATSEGGKGRATPAVSSGTGTASFGSGGASKAGIKNLSATVYARDTTNAPGLLSGHSFGVAMDFNSDLYRYGNTPFKDDYLRDLNNKKSKNHKYAKAIDILQKTGLWVWGGNYTKTKDAHHFTFKPYSS